jgi:hypothetical protein
MVGAGYVKQSEECTICLTIQTYVDNLLKKNDTVVSILYIYFIVSYNHYYPFNYMLWTYPMLNGSSYMSTG